MPDAAKRHEEFYVFCLNANKHLIKTFKIDGGLASSIGFPISDFVEQVSFAKNKSIVIMHTHPGGNSTPTKSDIIATKRLFKVASTLGIWIEDHIIVSDNNYYSFRTDSGMYETLSAQVITNQMDSLYLDGDEII